MAAVHNHGPRGAFSGAKPAGRDEHANAILPASCRRRRRARRSHIDWMAQQVLLMARILEAAEAVRHARQAFVTAPRCEHALERMHATQREYDRLAWAFEHAKEQAAR